nr:NADH dehydrogenase subunit 4L [Isocladus armatus]
MFLSGFVSFISNWNHLLSTLISLEFIALSLFFGMTFFTSLNFLENYCALFYLTLAVCEGALGLSILVLYSRSKGHDSLTSKNFLQW